MRASMTIDSNAKRVVLRGVYEDNLGLPRSFTGKRRPADDAPRDPVPTLGNSDGPVRTLGNSEKIGFGSLLALVVLLGFSYRAVHVESAEPREITVSIAEETLPDAADRGGAGAQPLASALEAATRPAGYPALATSSQYDAMLRGLDVPVADLFDLTVQTIVIDPGHGGSDPGAIGLHGLEEKDVALDIARRLRDKLEATGGYRVLLTRDEDRKMALKERVAFATQHQADLFISVHVNSVPQEAGPVNYVETYYFGPHADPRTLDLVAKENRDSDYAMGDFREIIAKIGDRLKTEESAQLATFIHDHLYGNLKRHSDDLLDAGAKSGPFVVLLGVEAPSVLVEVSCISNEAEAARLATPEYRDNIATYLQTGVVEYLARRALH